MKTMKKTVSKMGTVEIAAEMLALEESFRAGITMGLAQKWETAYYQVLEAELARR